MLTLETLVFYITTEKKIESGRIFDAIEHYKQSGLISDLPIKYFPNGRLVYMREPNNDLSIFQECGSNLEAQTIAENEQHETLQNHLGGLFFKTLEDAQQALNEFESLFNCERL